MEQATTPASANARHQLFTLSTTSNTDDAQTSAPQTDGETVENSESVVQFNTTTLTTMSQHPTVMIRRRYSAIGSTDNGENYGEASGELPSHPGGAGDTTPSSSRRPSLTEVIRRRVSQVLHRDNSSAIDAGDNQTEDSARMTNTSFRSTNNHTCRQPSQTTISIDHNLPNLLHGVDNNIITAPQSMRRSTTELSRPPSYQRYQHRDSGDQEHEREWQTLDELRELCRRRRQVESEVAGWLHNILWRESDTSIRWGEAIRGCCLDQFLGFYRIFWFVIFIFIGAMSIFIPSLPPSALALWAPFLIYVAIAVIIHYRRRREEKRITELEQKIAQMREQRIHDVLSAMELPQDHYFATEITDKHRHPVTTLLPPPPAYPHGASMRADAQSDAERHDEQRQDLQRIRAEAIVDQSRRESRQQ